MHFALYSAHAQAVELCVYDPHGMEETGRAFLPRRDGDVWSGFAPGLEAGCSYGYRVHGPFEPWRGHCFNPHKLVLDPYARALTGNFRWDSSHYGYATADDRHRASDSDNAEFMYKATVLPPLPPPQCGPATEWAATRIYEAHVRGFTQRHPDLSDRERGTVAGLGADACLEYLRALGITAIELLPVHAFVDEPQLHERGLRNYWGYNTLNWFAPHPAYLGDGGPDAFQHVVNRLHDAGLEVILDVVYNHSCEGDGRGPTLSLRGIDNYSYYRLDPQDPAIYVNDTGCGNTLATQHPAVRRLVLDSLRYWSGEMGIDGFRFDLAPVLARGNHGFDPHAALLRQIGDDAALRRCKLIAEPWDVGAFGYQLGAFPAPWAEWNDRYRDSVRRFWRGDDGELPELARRLHGSGELFETGGREAWASVNFVASHDGFTLRDLVSYARRHNFANGEDNRDGHSENYSDNCGVEGPTSRAEVNALRAQQQRNHIATLLLSQGVPMLQAGDEFGRSQSGNNNAYCQDNETSWLDWTHADGYLLDFTRALMSLRAAQPLLRADRFRHAAPDADGQSLSWVAPDGAEPTVDYWHDPSGSAIGCLLSQQTPAGQLLILLNAGANDREFHLPPGAGSWHLLVDTAAAPWIYDGLARDADRVTLAGRSLQLLGAGATVAPAVPPDAHHTGD